MKRQLALLAAVGVLTIVTTGCGASDAADNRIDRAAYRDTSSAKPQPLPAAEAFVELAETGADRVRWADRVNYSIAGRRVGVLAASASMADQLLTCPSGVRHVEGHRCPVSPLQVVADVSPGAVVESATPKRVGCNSFVPPADVPPGLDPVTIRPPELHRDCFSDFAVTLYVDDQGRVGWLDLALSGP